MGRHICFLSPVLISMIGLAAPASYPTPLASVLELPVMAVQFPNNGTGQDDLNLQGPWIYTERFNAQTNAVDYMAATPAKEDADTWLMIGCGGGDRVNAAVTHVGQFPFPVQQLSKIVLRTEISPTFVVDLAVTRPNGVMIAPDLARHILPLLIESKELAVSFAEPAQAPRQYSFSLRPNDMALAAIVSHCDLKFSHPPHPRLQ